MGMNARKRIYLDINPADRARLLASATAYAAGRRTYVVGAVSDVIAANAGRLDAAAREGLARAIAPAADAGDSIDAPAWTRALAALETAAPAEAVPLDRAPRADRRPVLLIAVAAMLAASLAVLGGWTAYEAGQPEPVRTKVVKRTVVKERVRTVTSCPTPAPPTAQGQAPAATTEPETDAAPQSQPTQSDDSQNQSQSTDTDSGTHDDGRNQTQEGESDVSEAEGSQAGQ